MRAWWVLSVCFIYSVALANDLSPQQEASYHHLLYETRCVTCLNQNLLDSNAPVAKAMREEIYDQLQKGQSEEQIRAFLIERYGEFVTFRPTFNSKTYLLWFMPALFVFMSIFGLKKIMRPKVS